MAHSRNYVRWKALLGLVPGLFICLPLTAQDELYSPSATRLVSNAPEWLSGESGVARASYLFDPPAEIPPAENAPAADDALAEAPAGDFESELSRLQKRIDQLEASEKKRVDSDKKK